MLSDEPDLMRELDEAEEIVMSGAGTWLSSAVRTQADHDLQALINTARITRALLDSGEDYTPGSLLADIAAMEAILRRLRQAARGLLGEAGDG